MAIDKDKVFELFGRYWEAAFVEGRTGKQSPEIANDILTELRDALDADDGDVFTGQLVEIDGHTYGLRPGAARVVREALRDAERWRLARTLLLMREQETMAGTRRYGLVVRPGYSFLDALGDPARAYRNQNNFDEECCRVDEAFDAAMAKDGA